MVVFNHLFFSFNKNKHLKIENKSPFLAVFSKYEFIHQNSSFIINNQLNGYSVSIKLSPLPRSLILEPITKFRSRDFTKRGDFWYMRNSHNLPENRGYRVITKKIWEYTILPRFQDIERKI